MIFQDLLTGFVNINFLVDFTVKLCLWFVSAVVFILHPELITTEGWNIAGQVLPSALLLTLHLRSNNLFKTQHVS